MKRASRTLFEGALCRGRAVVCALAPDGAAECSHGWSEAKPVDYHVYKTAPAGATELSPRGIPLKVTASVAPSGAKLMLGGRTTGYAAGGCAAAPLHPWLHSDAPSGAFRKYLGARGARRCSPATSDRTRTATSILALRVRVVDLTITRGIGEGFGFCLASAKSRHRRSDTNPKRNRGPPHI